MRQRLQHRPQETAALAALLGMTATAVEARMSDTWGPWAEVAVVGVLAALALALAVGIGRHAPAPSAVAVVVAASLVPAAFLLLLDALGASEPTSSGGGLTFALLLTLAVLWLLWRATGSLACVLLGPLVAVALLLESVNWIFGTEEIDVFRALLAVTSVALIAGAYALAGRVADLVAVAGGTSLLSLSFVTGGYPFIFLFFFGGGEGTPWGWGALELVGGFALLLYAIRRHAPGPGYLGGFVLSQVALLAIAIPSFDEEDVTPDAPSLVGWPLAIMVLTVVAAALVLRPGADETPDAS